jgi:hypothetical protein
MLLNNKCFWMFEAMMALAAAVAYLLFQFWMFQLNGELCNGEYYLVWALLQCPPFLIAGLLVWLMNKDDGWGQLTLWEIIFSNILLVSSSLVYCMQDDSLDLFMSYILFIDLLCVACSVPAIMLGCYLYRRWLLA